MDHLLFGPIREGFENFAIGTHLRRNSVPDSSDAHSVVGSVQGKEEGGSEGGFEPLINTNWALIFRIPMATELRDPLIWNSAQLRSTEARHPPRSALVYHLNDVIDDCGYGEIELISQSYGRIFQSKKTVRRIGGPFRFLCGAKLPSFISTETIWRQTLDE
jgi:hypothetical protein